MSNIGFLTLEKYDNRRPGTIGSSRIRGEAMMKYCPEIVPFENGRHYDAMIYQKAYFKDHMERFTGVKIFDLCDPDWFEFRPVRETLELVDGVTVPTESLAEFIRSMKPGLPVKVIPDRIDPEAHLTYKNYHFGPLRSVVWFGYSTNAGILDVVLEPLKDRNITLVVISDHAFLDADVNIKYDQTTVNEEIIKYDAVIMPTYDQGGRFLFKSDNKILTSWALKMPVIRDYEDLEALNDHKKRAELAEENYKQVTGKYHVKQSGREYLDFIDEIIKKRG